MENKTCAERIKSEYLSQEAWFAELYAKADGGDDQATQEIYEQAYGITRYTVVRIELSGGGPASWLEATLDSDHELLKVEYVFSDWFDVARRGVEHDSATWRYASDMLEGLYA